jgi:hypothetical protein
VIAPSTTRDAQSAINANLANLRSPPAVTVGIVSGAGVNLEVRRALSVTIDGGLGFGVDVRHVAAIQLDHLAGAEPNGDN